MLIKLLWFIIIAVGKISFEQMNAYFAGFFFQIEFISIHLSVFDMS